MKNIQILSFLLINCFLFYSKSIEAAIIHVNATQITGNQDGTSWGNAYSSLQNALQNSNYGDEIWVSQGTYFPTSGISRNSAFFLINGVKMYGGFTGIEDNVADRNWEMNATILSGDIGVLGDDSDNSYTVVLCSVADSTTVLDGFTISGGNANGVTGQFTSPTKSGGALYLYQNSVSEDVHPKIVNCRFTSNQAEWQGGAVFMQNTPQGGASSSFINCSFVSNTANQGGAISIKGTSKFRTIEIKQCEVDSNSAIYGGGIYLFDDYGTHGVIIDSCSFVSNFSFEGGAIDLQKYNAGARLEVLHSSFEFNQCAGDGIAIADFNYTPVNGFYIDECQFNENYTTNTNGFGGALIFLSSEIDALIKNCFFSNTSASVIGLPNSDVQIDNSVFYDLASVNEPSVAWIGGSGSNLALHNCTITQNSSENGSLFYSNSQGFISLNNCLIYDNDIPLVVEFFAQNGAFEISHSLIDLDTCTDMTNGDVNCGPGMLYNIDPLFADTSTNDFRLSPCSPARNAGDNNIITQQNILTDLVGNNRISENLVDLGAYEMLPYELQVNQSTNVFCNGDSSGMVNLDVQSACEPLVLFLDQDSIAGGNSPFVVNNLPAGNHAFSTIDAQGREYDLTITIEEPSLLEVVIQVTDTICIDATNGVATAIVEGGTQPYTYNWDNTVMDSFQMGLSGGNYLLTVTDGNDCSTEQSALIVENTAVSVTSNIEEASGATTADGSIVLDQITGGSAPYSFAWSTGATTQNISNLLPDDYSLVITDALGCEQNFSFTVDFNVSIGEPDEPWRLLVFPNPVESRTLIYLDFKNTKNQEIKLQLLDVTSRVLWEKALEGKEDLQYSFTAPEERGLYVLLLIGEDGERSVHRIIVD